MGSVEELICWRCGKGENILKLPQGFVYICVVCQRIYCSECKVLDWNRGEQFCSEECRMVRAVERKLMG